MSLTADDLWLEDRRQFLDAVWNRVWWTGVHILTAAGVLGALVSWGLVVTSLVALAVAVVAIGVELSFRSAEEADAPRSDLGSVADAGCATVAALGLLAIAAGWGLLLMLVLAVTSPIAHRTMRGSGPVLRKSLAKVKELTDDARPACEGPERP